MSVQYHRHRIDLVGPLPGVIRGGGVVVGRSALEMARLSVRPPGDCSVFIRTGTWMEGVYGEWIKKGKEKSSAWREWLLAAAMGIPSEGRRQRRRLSRSAYK